jgi:hypothetical protein
VFRQLVAALSQLAERGEEMRAARFVVSTSSAGAASR